MTSDPVKHVLDYAEPTKGRAFFSMSAFVPGCVMAGMVLVTLCALIPRFEILFSNFGMELPAMTKALLGTSRVVRAGGWIAIAVAPVVLGFVAGLVPPRPLPPPEFGQRRRSAWWIFTKLFILLFLAVCVIALVLPMMTLIAAVSGGGK